MASRKQMYNLRQEVALTDVRIFAFHGFYPEEQVLGNEYFIDVILGFVQQVSLDQRRKDSKPTRPFERTINYEDVYQLIKKEMLAPRQLLESVCEDILQKLLQDYSFLIDAKVQIRKSNPPFGGDQATSSVSLSWFTR